MTIMRINLQDLEAYLGKKVSLEKLKESISMLGTDLDSIEGDEIIVEIFPNRPDLLSFQGFARAIAAFLNIKPGLRIYDVDTSQLSTYRVEVDVSVRYVRPYTACAIVKGIECTPKVLEELIDMQEKLHLSFGRDRKRVAIGIYPLEKFTLPIRYCARRPEQIVFTPLDWSSPKPAKEILEHHPAGKKYGHLLAKASMYPVFEDAQGKILSMPPIINSQETGRVTTKTRELFIECSGHHLVVVEQALAMITSALADKGAKLYAMSVEYPDTQRITPDLRPRTIRVKQQLVQSILGNDFLEIGDLLGKMGMSQIEKSQDAFLVQYPAYRTDILHPIDIVEDLAIAYGYQQIPEELPSFATIGQEDPLERFKHQLAEHFVGFGMIETSTYHLLPYGAQSQQMLLSDFQEIELADSKTEYTCLRQWLLPCLVQVAKANTHHEYPQSFFEIGTCFFPNPNHDEKIGQEEKCALLLAPGNYTDLRQILDNLFLKLRLPVEYQEHTHPSFI
ncbi:MAG: phenylalanine--tRNA ligase subunit beta, partial [Candidatus Woesearchaeota archaeon]